MGLSSDLISQFVKATKDTTKPKKETTLNGTTVLRDGKMYVKLDGSDLLTPVSSETVTSKENERVTVTIKNHTATVNGNVSAPAARDKDVKEIEGEIAELDILVANKVSAEVLEAERARIDNLVTENVTIRGKLDATEAEIDTLTADNVAVKGKIEAAEANIEKLSTGKLDAEVADLKYATIEELDATNVNVRNLDADFGDFEDLTAQKFTAVEGDIKKLNTEKLSVADADIKYADIDELDATNANVTNLSGEFGEFKNLSAGKFTAIEADISDLETKKLSAESADLKYANIDFSNIGKATMEYFYAQSGLIKDVTVGDQTITGHLVGVTISGDLIEGNTIKAEKLVIKGSDGLYYQLNTNGTVTETEQTDQNSLNGSIIKAKSITASKINVKDLVAFGATIGGFHITDNSMYSGSKAGVGNTTRGIYLDNDGQIAFGDSANYVKFYKNTSGNYKLAIAADDLVIGGSGTNVEDAITSAQTAANNASSKADSAQSTANTAVQNAANAQNAADKAQEDINNLEIGGRNLALSSDTIKNPVSDGIYETYSLSEHGKSSLRVGQLVTISFDAYADSNTAVDTYIRGSSGAISIISSACAVTTSVTRFSRTVTVISEGPLTVSVRSSYEVSGYTGVNVYVSNIKVELGNRATDWTPAPEDVDSDISNAQNSADNASSKADSAQSTANTASSKADTAQSTANTAVQNAANAQSTANTASSKADTAQSTADTARDEASAAQNAADKAQSDIDNLSVGGRNLLLDSRITRIHSNNSSLYPIEASLLTDDTRSYYRVKRTSTTSYPTTFSIYNNLTKSLLTENLSGEEVTFSVLVRCSHSAPMMMMHYAEIDGVITYFPSHNGRVRVSTTWQRIAFTATIPAYDDSSSVTFRFLPFNLTDIPEDGIDNFYLDLCEWKIEKGNRPTDWTPAPEDIESEMSSVKTRVTEAETQITRNKEAIELRATKTEVQEVDSKFANYSTTAQMNSALTVKANEITSHVSATYTTKEDFDNLEVGGRNLWFKTKEYDASAYTGWGEYYSSKWNRKTTTPYTTVNGFGVQRIAQAWTDVSQYVPMEPNTDYTLSAWIKWESTAGQMMFYSEGATPNTANVTSQVGTDTYKRVSFTFRHGTSANSICRFECTTSTPYLIYGLKLEKGNKPTDWTPAPEDVDARIESAETRITQTEKDIQLRATTEEMNAAIKVAADGISSEVSSAKNDIADLKTKVPWVTAVWLDATAYDESLWIPFTGTSLPAIGSSNIRVGVALAGHSVPSWSTHSGGFSVEFEVEDIASGWGTSQWNTRILADKFSHCAVSPVSYTQLGYASIPVLYLRGGGKYHVKTSYKCTWTACPDGYTWTSGNYSQSAPTHDSRPKPQGDSYAWQADMTEAKSKIDQQAGQITAVVGKANQNETDIASLKLTNNSFEVRFDTVEGDVDTAIEKATQAQSSANTAQSIANTASSKADTAQTTANNAKDKIENLSIGGKNLFKQSGHWTALPTWWTSNGGGIELDTTEKYLGYNTLKTSIGAGIVGNNSSFFELDPNKVYTYSAMIKSSANYTGNSVVPLHYHCSTDKSSNAAGVTTIAYDQTLVAGEWKKLYLTFKPNAKWFRPFIYTGASPAITINIAYIKLEEGNVATDWTPSPDDVDSAITTAQNTANTANTNASAAQTTANNATTLANNAQADADAAQSTANTASSKADTAQSTANTANSTANSVKTDLANNYTKKTIPDTRNDNQNPEWYMTNYPRQIVTEFKSSSVLGLSGETYCTLTTTVPWGDSSGGYPKQVAKVGDKEYWRIGYYPTVWSNWNDPGATATNYMKFENGKGLIVGDMTSGTLGANVLIDSDSMSIRLEDTVLAEYTANAIYLGKNNVMSVIDLCDGTGTITSKALASGTDWWALDIHSQNSVGLSADSQITMDTNYSDGYVENSSAFRMVSSEIWQDHYTPSYASLYVSQRYTGGSQGYVDFTADALTGMSFYHSAYFTDNDEGNLGISGITSVNVSSSGIELNAGSSSSGAVDVYGDLRLATNNERIWGKRPDGSFVETFQPQNQNGNTVIGWGNYDNASGNTNIYGNDVYIGVASVGKKTFRPYFGGSDSVSFTYRGAGYVTSGGEQIYFTISLSKPLVGSPTVSIVTSTLVLRQNGNYTHGSAYSSSGYTYAKPSSYSVTRSADGSALSILLRMSNTTNAVNNAPIGIDWLGAITFSYG